jgi:hypothetical protein
MSRVAVALRHPYADVIASIPRHPADPTIAYGENLDREFVTGLVRDRILTAAIFPNAVSPEEIATYATPELQQSFREACQHFTQFFVSREKGLETDLTRGVAVMRGLGERGHGFIIETPGFYEGRKNLRDFLPDNWLIDKVQNLGNTVTTPRGYGYHIYQAFPGMAAEGYYARWHGHEDINAHITFAGATLEFLPSDVDLEDVRRRPKEYQSRIQRPNIGDMMVFGRLPHRSSEEIPEEGQFAAIGHGSYEFGNGD